MPDDTTAREAMQAGFESLGYEAVAMIAQALDDTYAKAIASARQSAIEEAARVAETMPEERGDACDWIKDRIAAAIRQLGFSGEEAK